MKGYSLNKDKVIYTITFHLNEKNRVESYDYQTEVSSFGFLDDNTFTSQSFDPDDDIDKDYVLGIMSEPELDY